MDTWNAGQLDRVKIVDQVFHKCYNFSMPMRMANQTFMEEIMVTKEEFDTYSLDEISLMEAWIKERLRTMKAVKSKKASSTKSGYYEKNGFRVGDIITFTLNKKTYTREVIKITDKTLHIDLGEEAKGIRSIRYIQFAKAIKQETIERMAA